jgi:serine phosphatase RsbU (regulator of sigma subunit)/ligand-binding sensor domain-containing protein
MNNTKFNIIYVFLICIFFSCDDLRIEKNQDLEYYQFISRDWKKKPEFQPLYPFDTLRVIKIEKQKCNLKLINNRPFKKGINFDYKTKLQVFKKKSVKPKRNSIKFNKLKITNEIHSAIELPRLKENVSYFIKKINRESGLPTGYINSVCSDNQNQLWLGTKGFGLIKYEINRIKIFNMSNGFPTDQIQCVFFDNKHNILWIGTTGNGIIIYDGKDFYHTNTELGLSDNVITSFYLDSKDFLWYSTNDGGVGMFNKDFTQIMVLNTENAFDTDNIRSITEDSKGNIWFSSAGSGLYKFDYNFIYNYTKEKGLPDDIILSSCRNNNGEIWFGSDTQGLFYIDKNDSVFGITSKSGLTDNCITSITSLGGSRIIAGTFEGGINIIDEKKTIIPITKQHGLTSNKIFSLLTPDVKTIISVGPEGLNFIYPDLIRFYDDNDGIENAYIKDITFVAPDKLYLASYGNSVLLLKNDSLFQLETTLLKENRILSADVDNELNLWFTAEEGNLYCLKPNNELQKFVFNDFEDIIIQSLAVNNESVWFGTDGAGLFEFLPDKNLLYQYKYKNGLAGNNISHVNVNQDYIFVTCDETGISIIKDKNIISINEEEHGLPTNRINSTYFYDHSLYVCSDGGGLFKIEDIDKENIHIKTINSLNFPSHIRNIAFDERFVILTSSEGIHIFRKNDSSSYWIKDLEITHKNILRNPEFISGSYSEDYRNNIYLSTASQLLKLNKVIFKNKMSFENLYLSSVHLNGIPITDSVYNLVDNKKNIFEKSAAQNINFSIPYNYGQIILNLSYCAWFPFHDQVQLYYKVNRNDDKWLLADNNRGITLTNLESGDYNISVKMTFSDFSIEKNNIITLSVLPPWWKTKWAQFLFVLALLIIVSFVIRIRTKNLINQKIQLENIVKERTKEIEHQKELLEEKNKNILDSITYTKRLQNSSLPTEKDILEIFNESFVLYKPRDIVSGDFYFSTFIKTNDGISLRAMITGDCTGHGVPGAFLSILILAYVKQSLGERDVNSPAEALEFISKKMKKVLEYRVDESEVRDSADMSFLVYDDVKNIIYVSCANNPVYIVRDKKLIEIPAQKRSVGYSDNDEPFKNLEFKVQKGDMIYMFSDGYSDQFGKNDLTKGKEKKFTRKRFKDLLVEVSELSINEQKKVLMERHLEWKGPLEQTDDILVSGLKILS